MKNRLLTLLSSKEDTHAILTKICQLLYDEIPYFNWVGFYLAALEKKELHLYAYVGAPTDHTVIPYGKGICGQVALSGETFEVPDVQEQDNYLACSIETKAELVVPIIKEGINMGQLDIDSHYNNPFSQEDIKLMEWLCEQLAALDFKDI